MRRATAGSRCTAYAIKSIIENSSKQGARKQSTVWQQKRFNNVEAWLAQERRLESVMTTGGRECVSFLAAIYWVH